MIVEEKQEKIEEEVKVVVANESGVQEQSSERSNNPYTFENVSMEKGEQVHLKDFNPLILQTRKDVKNPPASLFGYGQQ